MLMTLGIGLVMLVLVAAFFAPLESLSWYAGWQSPREVPDDQAMMAQEANIGATRSDPAVDHFMVYLSGIGAISGLSVPAEEEPFLAGLAARLPRSVLIRDVFPYSVTNSGLNGQRAFARFWRWIEQQRMVKPGAVLPFLINVRNLFQVAVSADRRYGPVFNYGVAQEIVRRLKRHGYVIGEHKPVTILGFSGGGQIGLGAATYLQRMINAPVQMVSVGGVLSDDPGCAVVVHLYHFYGSKDPVQDLGVKLYPGRWPGVTTSYWGRALDAGKITLQDIGPYAHNGKGNYYDTEARLPDGRTHCTGSIDAICAAVETLGVPTLPAAERPDGATLHEQV